MSEFDSTIRALDRELLALKAAKDRNAATLRTNTTKIALDFTFTLYGATTRPYAHTSQVAEIVLNAQNYAPFVTTAIEGADELLGPRSRKIHVLNGLTENGELAIYVYAYGGNADVEKLMGGSAVRFSLYIDVTSTSAISPMVSYHDFFVPGDA